MRFDEVGLDEKILEAISYMGFENLTPIQEKAIPEILNNRDLLACAQTGTGKTAAFILPLLNKLVLGSAVGTSALIIVPTRELAVQIDQQLQGFAYFVPVSSLAVYGGGSGSEWETQKKALKLADIIIATPGKLISHINMNNVNFKNLQYLVLDEADRMMDMGFYDDIAKIISKVPKERQTLMFSATMPSNIRNLAKKFMQDPFEISLAISKPSENILQIAYLVNDDHKPQLIRSLIDDKPGLESVIIFSSTKKSVNKIIRGFSGSKYKVEGISSDLEQQEREDVLNRFRAKQTRVIVATDVLSRGIDIKDINLVINYNVPGDGEDYVHRIGRTARADASGVAITLVNPEEMYKFAEIEKLIEMDIRKLDIPSDIGISPEWNPTKHRKGKPSNKNHSNRPKNKSTQNQKNESHKGKGPFSKKKRYFNKNKKKSAPEGGNKAD